MCIYIYIYSCYLKICICIYIYIYIYIYTLDQSGKGEQRVGGRRAGAGDERDPRQQAVRPGQIRPRHLSAQSVEHLHVQTGHGDHRLLVADKWGQRQPGNCKSEEFWQIGVPKKVPLSKNINFTVTPLVMTPCVPFRA